jgi:hypothetical protein
MYCVPLEACSPAEWFVPHRCSSWSPPSSIVPIRSAAASSSIECCLVVVDAEQSGHRYPSLGRPKGWDRCWSRSAKDSSDRLR